MGNCQLCGKEKKLIKAHIIPESFYKELYDEKHSFIQVVKNSEVYEQSSKRKGLYDENILCEECDKGLSKKYDDYGAKTFWGYENLSMEQTDFRDRVDPRIMWREVKNVDVKRVKLFLLSILWRGHISKLDFFHAVDLGNLHAERIRRMIIEEYAGDNDEYPVLLMHYAINDTTARRLLSSINRYKKDGKTFYAAFFCGIMVSWFISPGSLPKGFDEFILNDANGLKILFSPKQGVEAVHEFLGKEAFGDNSLVRKMRITKKKS